MHNDGLMYQVFIFLVAAVISVPIAKRLGLGSVLGYLIAGAAIGPFALGLVGQDIESIMHFAEFGVVMMLFLVGLELQPSLLWKMRLPILGLGGMQVALTTGTFMAMGIFFGFPWQTALAVSLILALSSTAIVLQSLNEKGLMSTEAGQSSFAVLLFQDIAVIPMMAILPLLALQSGNEAVLVGNGEHGATLVGWQQGLLVLTVVSAIILCGHFLIRPLFNIIAGTRMREIFTATALLLVVGIALLMELVGLSAALGTFIAGVVLADNEYRHELEAEIEPFKGLLLGLFFISVGASIDFALLAEKPLMIFGMVGLLVAVKFIVLILLAKLFKLESSQQWTFTFGLAQGGEFGFVLFALASQQQILSGTIIDPLVVVVALSMAFTPVLMMINEKLVQPLFNKLNDVSQEADVIDDGVTQVIVAGFGRFGQIVERSLSLNGYSTTVLEHDVGQLKLRRKFGHKVFYGDASRQELLHAAGAETAKVLVIALADHDKAVDIIHICQKHYPQLKLYVRARGRIQAHELHKLGVDGFIRDTLHSALHMSEQVMNSLGRHAYDSHRAIRTFRKYDEQHLLDMIHLDGEEKSYISSVQKNKAELEKVLQSDFYDKDQLEDKGWAGGVVNRQRQ
ncbi:MAG: potassium transporter [Moraxellaceae bacterium]|nr:MAG: potassium transporter [Moraxellaceae bacterium]